MEKIKEMPEQKFKSYEENMKSYLVANNEILCKKINEPIGKLDDLQTSVKHSDEVDRNVSHINWFFRNRAKTKTIIYSK